MLLALLLAAPTQISNVTLSDAETARRRGRRTKRMPYVQGDNPYMCSGSGSATASYSAPGSHPQPRSHGCPNSSSYSYYSTSAESGCSWLSKK